MKPNDLIFVEGVFYEVMGVFLGAEGQESVVELRCLVRTAAVAYARDVHQMFVPDVLLRASIKSGAVAHYTPCAR